MSITQIGCNPNPEQPQKSKPKMTRIQNDPLGTQPDTPNCHSLQDEKLVMCEELIYL